MVDVLLVDTTMGNLRSVERALVRAGASVRTSHAPDDVRGADRVVVPGQGGFGGFAEALDGGLRDALVEHIQRDRPYLGICLGMQILFEHSEEAPGAAGLGVFAGGVKRLPSEQPDPDHPGRCLKIPHMGWNQVTGAHALTDEGAWYYFVHSYACVPDDPSLVVGRAMYGQPVTAAVSRGAAFACQFHPEKSQAAGARLLARFLGVTPEAS